MSPLHFFATVIAFLIIGNAHAQNIQGRVTDRKNEPVPYAVIITYSLPDTTLLKTELTDAAGQYSIPAPGKYPALLVVNASGYRANSKLLDNFSAKIDIVLDASVKELNDVTISSHKKVIEQQIDRTVFNVENSISSIGSDAYDVLKKAPGVRVAHDGVMIAGKSTVSIMINDKLVQLPAEELESLLRSIPADNVSRIEIITTPPAKYDAQGNAGIVNIITKKYLADGMNGNITSSYTQRIKGSENIEGAFNWRNGKLNVFGNANSTWLDLTTPRNTTIYYPAQVQMQHLDQTNTPWFYRADVGADYKLSPHSTIGILYTNGNMDKQQDQFYTTRVLNNGYQDSVMNTRSHQQEYGHRDVINVNYEWDIDTAGKKLNMEFDYFNRKGNTYRVANMQNFFTDGTATAPLNNNATYAYNNILMKYGKVDLNLPTRIAVFAIGAKLSATQNTSENIYSVLDNNVYVLDTLRSDHFKYKEQVEAAYASAQRSLGKWELKAGVRAEYTNTQALSEAMHQTVNNDYLKLFPTAYLRYKMNDENILGITYSSRIDRPEFWIMNPFRNYFDANSYEQGNPFLQPAFSKNLELNYTLKSTYTITLFTQQVEQQITRLAITDATNNNYYYTQTNSGTTNNYGLSAAADINPTNWWEGNLQAYGYYNVFRSSYYGNYVKYHHAAFTIDATNTFTLNKRKTLLAELGCNYTSFQQLDYDIQLPEFFAWGAIKALFYNKQLAVALSTEDPFRTNKDRTRNMYNGTVENNYFDNRQVQVAITWKFGKRFLKDTKDHGNNDDDARRIK